ncbi:MAG: helix-turn-helix transcriptional regulator [Patescibacteria group bacterium]|jgi:transcriptional regulator with XRE-family HTH domain
MNLGVAIKAVRTKRNLSQAEFANLVGCSESHISLMETNRRKPSFEMLVKISEITETKLSQLFLIAEMLDTTNK